MQKSAIAILVVLALLPFQDGLAQFYDTDAALGISLTSQTPYSYRADDGSTVIIGEVQNTRNFAVTNVKIWAGFYDNVSQAPLESAVGSTILDVIPANGRSPYVITSSQNPEIVNVSVSLQGFISATEKPELLNMTLDSLSITDRLSLVGTITNESGVDASEVRVHVIIYDGFEPPRFLRVETIQLEEPLAPGESEEFELDTVALQHTAGVMLSAESAGSLSNVIDEEAEALALATKKITIRGISIQDRTGSEDILAGSPVLIRSNIGIQVSAEDQYNQEYVYYAQVKQSGQNPAIEYLGISEGRFTSSEPQEPVVAWTPDTPGLYFIETFVWDSDNVALSEPGPITIVLVK